MLQKDNRYKILRLFFEDTSPTGIGFQLREISRKVEVAPPSVKKYLEELEKEELIIKQKHRIYNYPVYYANKNNETFKFLKRIDLILKIKESGIMDYVSQVCTPEAIVLFGQASQGEDSEKIELLIASKEVKLDLEKFSKKIEKKINLHFNTNFSSLNKEMQNEVVNGIILKGSLKI